MRREYVVNLHETQRTLKLNIKRGKGIQTLGESLLTGVLPSRDSEITRAIMRIAKTNAIFKRPINKLFRIENTYHEPTKRVWQGNQSNAPLIDVYPNTIETCLTPNFFFFVRQLL